MMYFICEMYYIHTFLPLSCLCWCNVVQWKIQFHNEKRMRAFLYKLTGQELRSQFRTPRWNRTKFMLVAMSVVQLCGIIVLGVLCEYWSPFELTLSFSILKCL